MTHQQASAAARDGYIFAQGRKLYHIYKQSFPMEFWYGLTPDDNREDAVNAIDVRTLPEKYRTKPVETRWTEIPHRSWGRAMRDQLRNHALAFANALFDGYSLEDHVRRERKNAEAESAELRAKQAARDAERKAAGLCKECGLRPGDPAMDDLCPDCDEIPF